MKIIIVVGARPNFMKAAPLLRAFKKHKKIQSWLLHTGQHFDFNMSKVFFRDLHIKKPDFYLGVGAGSHAYQTAEIMKRSERIFLKLQPDYVIVVGDVNSTLAAALTAAKMKIKVAHVEAGLRSFDRSMPEEINRLLTDQVANLLFTTHPEADKNLIHEGYPKKRIHQVGDLMADNLLYEVKRSKINRNRSAASCAVLTLHRPANTDNEKTLRNIMKMMNKIAQKIPVIFPVHPRTRKKIKQFRISLSKNMHLKEPLGYRDFLKLYQKAIFVMTDSGGIQLETSILNIPCLTLREITERPSTVEYGTNTLIGQNPVKLYQYVKNILAGKKKQSRLQKFWDGKASERIVRILWKFRHEIYR